LAARTFLSVPACGDGQECLCPIFRAGNSPPPLSRMYQSSFDHPFPG
jgi:hypothetical protein